MKAIIYLIFIVSFISCTSQSPKASEESIQKAKEDSLLRIREDSIRKANEAKIAYENRPWKLNHFVDNFGDPTKEAFIYTYVTGKFSNSAATNKDLWVKLLITKDVSALLLYEYSPSGQPEKFIGNGKMLLKNKSEEKIELFIGGDWNQSGGVKISNSNHSKFISFLKKSPGEIKVVVYDDYSSVYNFIINGDGFNEEYLLLDKK